MNTALDEQEVRAVLDRWVDTSTRKDIDSLMDCYAPDVVAFDAVVALQFEGRAVYRKHWEYCLGFAPNGMHFEIYNPAIIVGGEIAFCHYLATCGCTNEDGILEKGWTRGTVCLRRIDGQWKIVHEHFSMPFDPESMQALTELEP